MPSLEELESGSIGVVVGRFQVPSLHKGHLGLLDHVCKLHKDVLIILGSTTAKGSIKDPMDFDTRKSLFNSYISSKVYTNGWMKIANVMDHGSDKVWSQSLDKTIAEQFPGRDVVLYGGRDSFIPHYHGIHRTSVVPEIDTNAGNSVRAHVAKMPVESEDFRKGVIYGAYNQWPRVFATCDIGIVRKETAGWEILIAHKWKGDQHRLVGGFADPGDLSFEASAIREAKEETGLDLKKLVYVTSCRQTDFRYKDRDRIITTLFMADVTGSDQVPVAGDDIIEVEWLPLNVDLVKDVHPTHKELVATLQEYLRER